MFNTSHEDIMHSVTFKLATKARSLQFWVPFRQSMKRLVIHSLVAGSMLASLSPARAHGNSASDASALSALPIAISVAGAGLALSAGVTLTIVAVEASAAGTVWVFERASDGARMSVTLAGSAVGGLSLAAGTAVTVSVVATGCVLSAAGRAIAFVPNAIGTALLYNERVTR